MSRLAAAQHSIYEQAYRRAVNASTDVFQSGGPLSYLLKPGQSCLEDGPRAAAEEIKRLRQALCRIVTAEEVYFCYAIAEEALGQGPRP